MQRRLENLGSEKDVKAHEKCGIEPTCICRLPYAVEAQGEWEESKQTTGEMSSRTASDCIQKLEYLHVVTAKQAGVPLQSSGSNTSH